jgi:hypothetical protein
MTFLGRLVVPFTLAHWKQILSLAVGLTSLVLLTVGANTVANMNAVAKAVPLALLFGVGVTFAVYYPIWFVRVWLESRRAKKPFYNFVMSSAYHELLDDHSRALNHDSDR